MAEKKHSNLTLYILIAIVVAILLALLLPYIAEKLNLEKKTVNGIIEFLHLGGEVFLRMLKMMVVPLVISSVMAGILGMGDVRKLGKPGGYTILYYLTTTLLAVAVGLVVVNVIRPGIGTIDKAELQKAAATDKEKVKEYQTKLRKSLAESSGLEESEVAKVFPEIPDPNKKPDDVSTILNNLVLMLFTDNLIESAANSDLLPLIVFSIFFAGLLTTMGSRVDGVTRLINQVNDALMSFVLLIMQVAPLGIFCLVAARFGKAHAQGEFFTELSRISWYMLTVLSGLAIHAFVTLPLIYWIFTKKNPYKFMYDMSKALLTAFSTASSSATLPVTIETAVDNAGVSRESTEFVLPLGATINMDGTALYEAAAAIFIAQVYSGIDPAYEFGLLQQLTVAVTATLAAIGAAGIPEAGLVTMLIVLNAVGLPLEYIGLILSVDWLLDRFRTTVNVFGDATGAAVIEQTIPKREPDSEQATGASVETQPA